MVGRRGLLGADDLEESVEVGGSEEMSEVPVNNEAAVAAAATLKQI